MVYNFHVEDTVACVTIVCYELVTLQCFNRLAFKILMNEQNSYSRS